LLLPVSLLPSGFPRNTFFTVLSPPTLILVFLFFFFPLVSPEILSLRSSVHPP
jgi:hypothetical protein